MEFEDDCVYHLYGLLKWIWDYYYSLAQGSVDHYGHLGIIIIIRAHGSVNHYGHHGVCILFAYDGLDGQRLKSVVAL